MRAGSLRHTISLDGTTRVRQPGGDYTEVPTTIAAGVPAAIRPLEGTEKLRAMAVSATLSHEVTIRYRAGVTAATTIRWPQPGGDVRRFNVRSVVNPGERNESLVMLCEEVRG